MQRKIKFFALVLLSTIVVQSSYAIDLQPGDVIAPKPGIKIAQLSYQYSEKNDFYSHGKKDSTRPAFNSSAYYLRVGGAFELAQMPAFFYVQSGAGAIHTEGLAGDKGLTDTTLAFAIWPYANRDTRTYFGAALYWVLPTGSYDSTRLLSMGENRHRTALQFGYETPLLEKLAGMVAFDSVWYSDNTDSPLRHQKLEQDNLYTTQMGLRYDFNPQYSLTGTYYYTFGGERRYDGLDANDPTRLQRFQVSSIGNYSFGQILVQYSKDLKTENGYFEDDRLTLRYTMRF